MRNDLAGWEREGSGSCWTFWTGEENISRGGLFLAQSRPIFIEKNPLTIEKNRIFIQIKDQIKHNKYKIASPGC